jgi:hypothetical protein
MTINNYMNLLIAINITIDLIIPTTNISNSNNHKILSFKKKKLTSSSGVPVASNQNIMTAAKRVPVLCQ